MNAFELIQFIRYAGGEIAYDNEQLIIDANDSVCTDKILDNVKQEKPSLCNILQIEQLIMQIRANHSEAVLVDLSVYLDGVIEKFLNLNQLKSNQEIVNCNNCEHFTPDALVDGVGIGVCNVGIKWTKESHGRVPLYRYAERHCEKHSKIIS